MLTAEDIILQLHLQPHPKEGGFYRETYRSSRLTGVRSACTAIYYMLTPGTRSALHRLEIDEIFHFYLGDPVTMLLLHPGGRSETVTLGTALDQGQSAQLIVPAGTWMGGFLNEGGRFALMGTTVAPGFEFTDYEEGDRGTLIREFPDRRDLIVRLTATLK